MTHNEFWSADRMLHLFGVNSGSEPVQVGWTNPNDWMKFVTDVSEIVPVVLVLAALLL